MVQISKLDIYTDGSYSLNRDRGGWSVYIPALDIRLCNGEYKTTINKMELRAVIQALDYVYQKQLFPKTIEIFTDSMYVVGGMKFDWTINTNQEIWNELHAILELIPKNVTVLFTHIDGHSGIEGNETADKLAVKASKNDF